MHFGLRLLAVVTVIVGTGACATIPPDAGSNPVDPFERYNRHMTEFNDRVDRAVLKPVAQAYANNVPDPVRDCVGNIFRNVADVPNAVNHLLQGRPASAVSDICRLVINTTVGVLGCFDVASKAGLEKSEEDFGQTLGRWGAGPGPYFVWPFLGPSTVRDAIGRVVDFFNVDPLYYIDSVPTRNVLYGIRFIDTRAGLIPAEKLIEGAALDRYQFIRDAFLQRRRNLIYDGNPPREREPDEEPDPNPATVPDQPKAEPTR